MVIMIEGEIEIMTPNRIMKSCCRLIADADYKRGCKNATWIIYWRDETARAEIESLIATEKSKGTPHIRIPRSVASIYIND